MKNKLILILLILVCSILIIINFNLNRENSTLKTAIVTGHTKKMDSVTIRGLELLVLTHGESINVELKRSYLVSDSSGKSFKLGSLIDKKKYIYHFDQNNCFLCVKNFLPFLKKLSDRVGKDNVLIIGSYDNPRYLFLALSQCNTYGIPIYYLNPHYLDSQKISKLNDPYIFEIDTTLNIRHVYIPDKSLPQLSDFYLKYLSVFN